MGSAATKGGGCCYNGGGRCCQAHGRRRGCQPELRMRQGCRQDLSSELQATTSRAASGLVGAASCISAVFSGDGRGTQAAMGGHTGGAREVGECVACVGICFSMGRWKGGAEMREPTESTIRWPHINLIVWRRTRRMKHVLSSGGCVARANCKSAAASHFFAPAFCITC